MTNILAQRGVSLMEWFNVGQLTKEMIITRLAEITDPVEASVQVLEKTLLITLKDIYQLTPGHRQLVVAACQGTMTALLLKELNLARGSVIILQRVNAVAHTLNLDPTDMMKLALHGIAHVRRGVTTQQIQQIGSAIDMEFMGAGEIFNSLCNRPPTSPAQPKI